MRLRPFFSYYGAKHRLARRYPAPQTSRILEPFAGSAGYATAHSSADVLLIDADPVICSVWEYLIRASAKEIRALPMVRPGECIADVDASLSQEARWLIGFWIQQASTHPGRRMSSWAERKHGDGSTYWSERTRERIAHQVRYIRHWKVVNGFFWQAPNVEADWFIDPPYQNPAGRKYRFGNAKIDFTALAEWTLCRKGQLIVCEQHGADWLPFQHFHMAAGSTGGKRAGISHEVIYHRPLFTELTLFDVA